MKTVFTSQEIAHIWANKSAPYGKSPGAVSFDGPVIRSYATAIARHIEHKGKAAIIYNATSYSVSTSKHQSRIWQAIRHNDEGLAVFRVQSQRMGTDLRFSGDELFTYYIEQAAEAEKSAMQPRIRPTTVHARKGLAAMHLENAQAVAAFFGLRKKVDEKAIARLAASKARAEKRAAAEQKKQDAYRRALQQSSYEGWLQGQDSEPGFNARLFPVAFRIEGDELVSTLGARVPLQAARVAYRFAMSKRGQEWRENGETCPVGHYRLNAINAQGIVAGCHRISWAELERLAPVLA